MHLVIVIAAAAGILRLLKRVLPARMAARVPDPPAGASSVDRRHLVFAMLAVVAVLALTNAVDLGALGGNVVRVFRELHGLN